MSLRLLALASPLALAACAGDGPRPTTSASSAPARAAPAGGLDRVMGQAAPALTVLFGPAGFDAREGPARKLQWSGPACVLDAYLYPPTTGGEPRVTWVDARTSTGSDIDRASCIAALSRAMPRK